MTDLIGKKVMCPIRQEVVDTKRHIATVAYFKGKIVSAKYKYGKIHCLVEPTGGRGAVACRYENLEVIE